jgi:phosphopantetheinyl transferase
VNAFGFGGINAHILLEEAPGGGRRRRRTVPGVVTRSARPEALLISAASREALLEALETGESRLDDGPCRLAILEPTAPLRERARKVVEHGAPFRDRKGHVWFTPAGEVERGGKVAFIFPGLDAGAPTPAWEVAEAFGRPPPTAYDPDDREELGAAIVMAGTVLAEVLAELGVEPDYLAGHSIGEWAAMIAAGCLGREAASVLLADREGSVLEFPDVAFASVGAGAHRIQAVLDRVPGAAIALDNCPHQTVVCGPSEAVREAVARLREGGVLCEELPFRSGFHSTFFADFLDPVRERLHSLELRAPTRPLWSATTCAPFPDDPDAIRALFLEHLVRPVRFRELVEALHADGARVFVQVGGGSLVGFVNDILVGRSHLAMPVLDPRLGGLAQLRRLAAALWVEGLDVDVGRLIDPGVERKARRTGMKLDLSTPLARMSGPLDVGESTLPGLDGAPDDDPVAAEFQATARALEEARRDVLAVWRRRRQAEPPPRPRTRTFRRTLSMELDPGLLDHSLFPTPDGWHRPEDGFPVVPMTMSLDMMMRAARELVPDRVPVAVEKVRAFRWMGVDAPLELDIEARYDGRDLVEVELGPYIHGRVRLADDYPPAPVAAGGPFPGEEAIEESAEEMYARRLMFHGPAYRSVKELVALHADGVRGKLVSLPAQGALLDGAGQVFGYWIKDQAMTDRLAFPVMLESLTVYGPEPPPGTVMDCAVWVRRFGKVQIRADIEVSSNGRVWAFCEGWEDRRLENDEDMWPVIQHPEEHALAEPIPSIPGAAWLRRPIESQWVRDSFARRYMGRAVHEAYKEMAEGRRKIDWHAGRIAAKDAVRHLLWARGEGPIFPVEIDVTNGPRGEPLVACPYVADLRISIAHRDGTAVALVGEGVPVGIDLERIEPRSAGFDDLAFTPEEQAFLPEGDGRDEWRTRLWAAKEAVAKWRGTGLDGDPMGIRIERVEGDRIYCEGRGIDTLREDDWVLAWIIGEDE